MAKDIYISVNGVAQKVASCYIGVNGVARKVKAGYVGVNGVARKFLGGLPPVGTALNDMTWAQVRAISDAGLASEYFSVGDTKPVTINGTVGNTTFSNLTLDAFIIGINHNESIEGKGIHFKLGKTSGTQVAICDSQYGNSAPSFGCFCMNTTGTNSNGWRLSNMRLKILGNSGTPSDPPSGSLLAALPSALLVVMKPVTKYSDNVGNGADTASQVTSTRDYLFLLSEFECRGLRAAANSAEQTYQAQYDYYKNGNSRVHYKHNAPSTAVNVWSRSVSVYSNSIYNFCCISATGSTAHASSDYSFGVSPGFVV